MVDHSSTPRSRSGKAKEDGSSKKKQVVAGEKPPFAVVSAKRSFAVSAERIYDAWLNPEIIGQWMFGSAVRSEQIVRLVVEVRVGGSFSFVVRRKGTEIDHVGTYLTLDRPNRLVFTWGIREGDSGRVSVEIIDRGAGCDLILNHELHPDWSDSAGRADPGWTKMLKVLSSLFD